MTRCPLLIVMGCEMPGYDDAMRSIADLEVRQIRGCASPEEVEKLRAMLDRWKNAMNMSEAIFSASYFCDPRHRAIRAVE